MVGRSRSEQQTGREQLEEFVESLFGEESHAKRVASLIDGVDGVLPLHWAFAPSGRAWPLPKPAIKPVDGESLFRCGVGFVLAERAELGVNFNWTAFEDSDQSLVVLGRQTRHGRSTPRGWKTVRRSALKDRGMIMRTCGSCASLRCYRPGVRVTAQKTEVPLFVCVHRRGR